MSSFIQPLETVSLTERLRDQVALAIVFGELEPGERIVEDDLSSRFAVSRSPVRHVLHELESQGLLVRESSRKLRVAGLDRRDLDEVYECRLPLEGICAASAARSEMDAASRGALFGIVGDLDKARQSGDARGYFLSNVAFTSRIHALSGNATAGRILASLGLQSQRYRYAAYRMFPDLMDVSAEGSREIATAIADGDAGTARLVTETLIERSWQKIRTCFND